MHQGFGGSMKTIQKWNIVSETTIVKYPIFSLHEMESASAQDPDKRGKFVSLHCPNWVNVIAITPDQRMVFVEQYRHGIREITWEIPGGLCDGEEDPIQTGLRELAEETGYVGERAEVIGVVQPNPAYQNNRCHTIIVHNVRCVQEQHLDEHEEIRILTYSLAEVEALVMQGVIQNAMVVSALYFFGMWRRKQEER